MNIVLLPSIIIIILDSKRILKIWRSQLNDFIWTRLFKGLEAVYSPFKVITEDSYFVNFCCVISSKQEKPIIKQGTLNVI